MDAHAVSQNVQHQNFSSMTGWRVVTNRSTKTKTADAFFPEFL